MPRRSKIISFLPPSMWCAAGESYTGQHYEEAARWNRQSNDARGPYQVPPYLSKRMSLIHALRLNVTDRLAFYSSCVPLLSCLLMLSLWSFRSRITLIRRQKSTPYRSKSRFFSLVLFHFLPLVLFDFLPPCSLWFAPLFFFVFVCPVCVFCLFFTCFYVYCLCLNRVPGLHWTCLCFLVAALLMKSVDALTLMSQFAHLSLLIYFCFAPPQFKIACLNKSYCLVYLFLT